MNKAGRLTTVKSVLYAIPIHQLLVFASSKKIIKHLGKIKIGFLWAGCEAANSGQLPCQLRRTCHPIEFGGLGIPRPRANRAGASLAMALVEPHS